MSAPPRSTRPSLLARRLRVHRIVLATLWVVLAAWPFAAGNDYLMSLGVYFLINLMLVASLNLIMGWTGQVSLAHAAFYGLGAYTSGVLNVRYGLSPWLGTAAAVGVTAACAALIGLACLRLRGPYLSMATLGFGSILMVLFVELVPLTGGPNGLAGIAPFALGRFELDVPERFFWFAWIAAGVVMWLMLNLMMSRPGRALRAIAGGEIGANTLGVDTFRYKVLAFTISAAFAGFAGALYAHFNLFASPETFGFPVSVMLLVMVSLGGAGHYLGPVYGALIYTVVPELLRRFQDVELLVFGLCMIVVLLRFPGGIAHLVDRVLARRQPAKLARPAVPTRVDAALAEAPRADGARGEVSA